MGFLDDDQVQDALDGLLSSAVTFSDSLMVRLVELGWKPVDETHTIFLAIMLLIKGYEDAKDDETRGDDAVREAIAVVISHPVIANQLSSGAANSVDKGVTQ